MRSPGFTTLLPLLVAALFWRGSTKWGALAVVVWTAATMTAIAILQAVVPAPPPGTVVPVWTVGGTDVVTRTPGGTDILGYMPVLPMLLGSALLMVVVSRLDPEAGRRDAGPLLPRWSRSRRRALTRRRQPMRCVDAVGLPGARWGTPPSPSLARQAG